MEIDITLFMLIACPLDYSASRAEIGENAGADTWQAACDDSTDYPMIDDDEKREAFRAHIRGFGAWDDAEIAAMTHEALNALFIQLVAGDMREAHIDGQSTDGEWTAYEADENAGRIWRGVDASGNECFLYYLGD